ncbi:MAG: GDYXXLXY domain-containing protein [Rhizobiaceae bacterium]
MKLHSRYLVAIAVVLALVQIGVLASMIMGRAAILRDGREVVLEVLPVDPRDLLRGEYVRLDYNISSLPIELFEGLDPDNADLATDIVHVRVSPNDEGIWEPVAARFGAAPQAVAAADEVDIRGGTFLRNVTGARIIAVDYGIERFYLPEGEGRAVEENLRERNFRMVVAVDDSGAAQIKAFYDGETLIYREPLY